MAADRRLKQYVFGYGSLVCPDDVARTLGRRVKMIYPVSLTGWIRDWSVVINNTDAEHRAVRVSEGSLPSYIVVLNVRRPLSSEVPTDPNGVLFEVTDEDLRKLDEREHHYRRLDVTADVVNAPTDGSIYMYTGLDEHLITRYVRRVHRPRRAAATDIVVIPGPYFELVAQGFAALGPDMHQAYLDSTRPSSLKVIRQPLS
ncbi:MAG TPA: gamma-glutamylcyclotransferase family protein [Candidatus Saccharimonadales bacterium]|nr:gamma-glutamylcyclotransferase family protein [Candidatus Saccharimonadales bacterium]